MKKIITICAFAACLTGCDDLFEPAIENNLGLEYMYENSQYAEGILANAYTRIPCAGYSFNDVATDDAVSNDAENSWRKIASGMWTANNNPADRWTSCRSAIQYINLFLANADKVKWAKDEVVAQMFCDREKAEAYGLRAMYMYYLLEAHAGYTEDGVLMGVPILTEPEAAGSNFNVPRSTFVDCMKALKEDARLALEGLPWEYGDAAEMQRLSAKYAGADQGKVTRVFGANFIGRMSGKVVEAFVAKADLLAASPAYSDQSGVDWKTAAASAAKVLNHIGGVDGMDPTGWTWYCNVDDIEKLSPTESPAEILWRGERAKSLSLEEDNFPPTLYGNGRINPTQNLVDAFPMLNGYPVSHLSGEYDENLPYANRDPRLEQTILHHGSIWGDAKQDEEREVDVTYGSGKDYHELHGGTLTGYYTKKFLNNMSFKSPTTYTHACPIFRYAEVLLNAAEAINEAEGPDNAYQYVNEVRARVGMPPYSGMSQSQLRERIRNERRIELCFEDHRFFDERRWKLFESKSAASEKNLPYYQQVYNLYGVAVTPGQSTVFNYGPAEMHQSRAFNSPKNYYFPIPDAEIKRLPNLGQNPGWEMQ